ncbi:hypothetical protein HHI36_006824 [Cryptolaemus montrouzieri]|uniref:Uncharacterized protein n=1 Tax=Cryptolaemus montrouzieri TaxID=559131 RepID=A0ABD2MMX1_9CUCU
MRIYVTWISIVAALLLRYEIYASQFHTDFSELRTEDNISTILYRFKRDPPTTECKIENLRISNCGIQVSRRGNEVIRATYEKTCNLKDISFVFYFGKDGVYSFNATRETPSLTVSNMKKELDNQNKKFSSGTHYIFVKMEAKSMRNEEKTQTSDKCTFYVIAENATAKLGRTFKNVRSDLEFHIDASKSINNDLDKKNKELEYRWSCVDTVGFCEGRDLGTDVRVGVPKEFAISGAMFNFTVEVRTALSSWQKALQIVRVNSSLPYSINCINNCGKEPGMWNPKLKTLLYAECDFFCNKYPTKSVRGVIVDNTGAKGMIDGLANNPHSIPSKPGEKYEFYVIDEKDVIIGDQFFWVYDLPKLENCRVIPPKGTPLVKYKVACDYDESQSKNFEVEVKVNGTVIFSASSYVLEEIEFRISTSAEVFIKIEDIKDVWTIQNVSVEVEALLEEKTNITEVNSDLNDIYEGKHEGTESVSDLIQSGQHKEAVQMIDIIAHQISKMQISTEEEENIVRNLKKKLLNDLAKINIENFDISKSISGVISLIATEHKSNESDSSMAKILAEMCNEISKKQLYMMENDLDNQIKQKDVSHIAEDLLTCGDSEMAPYYEMFNETVGDVEITTRYPIRAELSEKNFEDYPQYVSDDIVEEKVNEFLNAAENVINICLNMGESLILSSSEYDEPTYFMRTNTIIGIFKSNAVNVPKKIFHLHDVTIKPSDFLATMDTTISVKLCSYIKDPFWSASSTLKIPTNVLVISLKDLAEDAEIRTFRGHAMKISFGVNEDKVIKKNTTVSISALNENNSESIEEDFKIFIIKSKAGESFFIEFHLADTDILKVVHVEMERPTLKHFSTAQIVNKTSNRIFVPHSDDLDQWNLIGILPDEKVRTPNYALFK